MNPRFFTLLALSLFTLSSCGKDGGGSAQAPGAAASESDSAAQVLAENQEELDPNSPNISNEPIDAEDLQHDTVVNIRSINDIFADGHGSTVNVRPGDVVTLSADLYDLKGRSKDRSSEEFTWQADGKQCDVGNPRSCVGSGFLVDDLNGVSFLVPYDMRDSIEIKVWWSRNDYRVDTIRLVNVDRDDPVFRRFPRWNREWRISGRTHWDISWDRNWDGNGHNRRNNHWWKHPNRGFELRIAPPPRKFRDSGRRWGLGDRLKDPFSRPDRRDHRGHGDRDHRNDQPVPMPLPAPMPPQNDRGHGNWDHHGDRDHRGGRDDRQAPAPVVIPAPRPAPVVIPAPMPPLPTHQGRDRDHGRKHDRAPVIVPAPAPAPVTLPPVKPERGDRNRDGKGKNWQRNRNEGSPVIAPAPVVTPAPVIVPAPKAPEQKPAETPAPVVKPAPIEVPKQEIPAENPRPRRQAPVETPAAVEAPKPAPVIEMPKAPEVEMPKAEAPKMEAPRMEQPAGEPQQGGGRRFGEGRGGKRNGGEPKEAPAGETPAN